MNKNSEVARKMSYSIDLRKRVVDYVKNGGRIAQAAGLFQVGRATIYRWLGRTDLKATKVKRRNRKLDWQGLEKDVKENPDARLIDRAKKFGVRPSARYYALKEMKITRKKKERGYQERNPESRMKYYRYLRDLIKVSGSQSRVFIDESGFEEFQDCAYGWSKKGKKIWGEKSGKRGKRENLVAGRRKGKKDLIAPMVFTGSLNAEGFEGWLSLYLLPSLTEPSILIMDNAPIHRKTAIRELARGNGASSSFSPKIFSRPERY